VIQQLPNKPTRLRDAVCVFYLVLRALDTVEDDMAVPVETKLPILKAFHEHIHDKCAPNYTACCVGADLTRARSQARGGLLSDRWSSMQP